MLTLQEVYDAMTPEERQIVARVNRHAFPRRSHPFLVMLGHGLFQLAVCLEAIWLTNLGVSWWITTLMVGGSIVAASTAIVVAQKLLAIGNPLIGGK